MGDYGNILKELAAYASDEYHLTSLLARRLAFGVQYMITQLRLEEN